MEPIEMLDSLSLREKTQYADIPPNWKLHPLFCLSDISEEEIYYATSEDDHATHLDFFRKAPAFSLYLLNRRGEQTFSYERHTGIFSDKLKVFDASEDLLGSVQKHKTSFQAMDAGGRILYAVEISSEDPEVFHILKDKMVVGKISRRPCRIAEAGVSRKDHFGIVFPFDADNTAKGILLGVLLLINLMF